MKAFHFTLEAVRTLRQRQEQVAMEQYAQSLAARQQAADRLEAAERDLSNCMKEVRDRLANNCNASLAAQAHEYQRSLVKRRDDFVLALGAAERRVQGALQCMLVARQQREIVEKCADKQKASYQREVGRVERRFLDDLGGRRSNSLLVWKSEQA